MSLASIRSRAATILTGVTFDDVKKLRADQYQPDQINTPQALFDFEVNPQITLGSSQVCDYVLIVRVVDSRDSERAAQIRLDQLRDPHDTGGLKQLIEDDANWNSEVHFCSFQSCSATEVVTIAGVEYLSIEARFGVTA